MNSFQECPVAQTELFDKSVDSQQAVALALADDLVIAAPLPFTWMGNNSGAHHVEINIAQAIPEVIAALDHGAMETLSPEGTAAMFTEVIVSCKLALRLLHEAAEVARAVAHAKEVDVIAGDAIVKESNPMLEHSISEARAVFDSVQSAAKKELAVVAALG